MRIVCLAENTCRSGAYDTEHGLSLYIETNGRKILFDMGQSALFAQNAEKMGVDLEAVDFAVLSHGHYDHGGGLETFLRLNPCALVYVSRFAFQPHYNGTEKYIGLDAALEKHPRLIYTEDTFALAPDMQLFSLNQREKKYDMSSAGMTTLENGAFVSDDFRHEQYLQIEEKGKRVLISGCSHKGILDIVAWTKPDVLIGGFHFSKLATDDRLRGYAEQLDAEHTLYYTCHCTGVAQFEFMRKYMQNLHYLSTGDKLDL